MFSEVVFSGVVQPWPADGGSRMIEAKKLSF